MAEVLTCGIDTYTVSVVAPSQMAKMSLLAADQLKLETRDLENLAADLLQRATVVGPSLMAKMPLLADNLKRETRDLENLAADLLQRARDSVSRRELGSARELRGWWRYRNYIR